MKQKYALDDHFFTDYKFLSKLETIEILETTDSYDEGESFAFYPVNRIKNVLNESLDYFSINLKTRITKTSIPEILIQKNEKYIKTPIGVGSHIGLIFFKTSTDDPDLDMFDEMYGGEINFITHFVKFKPTAGSLLIFKNIPNNIHTIERVIHGSSIFARFSLS